MFALIAKLISLHTILALSTEYNLEVHQMDVKSAYLNWSIERGNLYGGSSWL
jgi:hypothetical protein